MSNVPFSKDQTVLFSVSQSCFEVPMVFTVEPFESMFSSLPGNSGSLKIVMSSPDTFSQMSFTMSELEVIFSQVFMSSSMTKLLE